MKFKFSTHFFRILAATLVAFTPIPDEKPAYGQSGNFEYNVGVFQNLPNSKFRKRYFVENCEISQRIYDPKSMSLEAAVGLRLNEQSMLYLGPNFDRRIYSSFTREELSPTRYNETYTNTRLIFYGMQGYFNVQLSQTFKLQITGGCAFNRLGSFKDEYELTEHTLPSVPTWPPVPISSVTTRGIDDELTKFWESSIFFGVAYDFKITEQIGVRSTVKYRGAISEFNAGKTENYDLQMDYIQLGLNFLQTSYQKS